MNVAMTNCLAIREWVPYPLYVLSIKATTHKGIRHACIRLSDKKSVERIRWWIA